MLFTQSSKPELWAPTSLSGLHSDDRSDLVDATDLDFSEPVLSRTSTRGISRQDPGPDLTWQRNPRVHKLPELGVNPDELNRFDEAIRSQGSRLVRLRALDNANTRWRASELLNHSQFRIYSAANELSKTGTADGGDPRCTLMSMERLGYLAANSHRQNVYRDIRLLEEVGAIVVVRFLAGRERRCLIACPVTPADRTGVSRAEIFAASRLRAEECRVHERELAAKRQRKHRERIGEDGGETSVTQILIVTEDVTIKSSVTSQSNSTLCHGENDHIDSTLESTRKNQQSEGERQSPVGDDTLDFVEIVDVDVGNKFDRSRSRFAKPASRDGGSELFDADRHVGDDWGTIAVEAGVPETQVERVFKKFQAHHQGGRPYPNWSKKWLLWCLGERSFAASTSHRSTF